MKAIYLRKEPRIPFTKDGFAHVLEEKKKLMSERPDAVEHLRKAREMGDLSENGYYKASRARLTFIDARIRQIDKLIRLGVVVKAQGSDIVEIGSTVIISDGVKEIEYTIVGGYESDPTKHTISYMSPLGKALFGKKLHDSVVVHAPVGDKTYTIHSISR